MARGENQKLKLLYLKQFLEECSDENHLITVQQMIDHLRTRDITAERKAIYSDMDCLMEFGMDISHNSGRNGGYYLASREFQLPELKLLVDAVQSSRFLTTKKSNELIEKISHLAGKHEAGKLKRQVVVTGRVKSMSESIYYNVDRLHDAIAQNSRIRFRYWEWTREKHQRCRPGEYEASPCFLVWADENYYLVAHTQRHGITHFRVDKMKDIQITGTPREKSSETKKLDPSRYGRNVFGMYGGTAETVRMRFHSSLIGVIIDRFGSDIILIPDGNDHVIFSMEIAVSPMFYGWIAGFGANAKILSPPSVVDAFKELCCSAVRQYDDNSQQTGDPVGKKR